MPNPVTRFLVVPPFVEAKSSTELFRVIALVVLDPVWQDCRNVLRNWTFGLMTKNLGALRCRCCQK
jgi:hypothetical protein